MADKEERQRVIGVVVDCCADIRSLYGALCLRQEKEKLGEVEELAQEQDTKALLELEEELGIQYEHALSIGVDPAYLNKAVKLVLPTERFNQLMQAMQPVPA